MLHSPIDRPVALTSLPYRPDIDGLRAVAVVAVVIFHFSSARLPGGFVGVDVFFVISGYLITELIMRELDNDHFSYLRFYARRIRRILPALILILLATMLLGFLILLPDEQARLAKEIIASSFFSYNFLLARETGYFDASAGTRPLLHLWSLGIEEQYYIVWPLLLVLIWRWSARRTVIATLAVTSFLLNIGLVYRYPSATFYLPFTRFWGVVNWLPSGRVSPQQCRFRNCEPAINIDTSNKSGATRHITRWDIADPGVLVVLSKRHELSGLVCGRSNSRHGACYCSGSRGLAK
jgi:peptidoglycan/LPS O-acetylase OafA/YrhL